MRGHLQGSVLLPGQDGTATQWWSIIPAAALMGDADSELTAVFRDEDLPSSETTCGVEDSEARPPAVSAPGREIRALRSPAEAAVLRLACDADLEFYAANGLQTIIQIGDVIVRTADPDPYTTTNPTALLVQERTDWTANHGDIARNAVQLFTGRDLDGTAVGIAFSDAVICGNYNNYSLVQSRHTTVLANRFALSDSRSWA